MMHAMPPVSHGTSQSPARPRTQGLRLRPEDEDPERHRRWTSDWAVRFPDRSLGGCYEFLWIPKNYNGTPKNYHELIYELMGITDLGLLKAVL